MANQTAAEMIAAARENIQNLSVDEVAAALDAGDTVVVDIREPAEQAASGMIPGAVSAPRGMLEFYADPTSAYHRPEFAPDRRVILYCASGGRSALAADMLRQLGYEQPAHLDGGIRAWLEAGKPVDPVE